LSQFIQQNRNRFHYRTGCDKIHQLITRSSSFSKSLDWKSAQAVFMDFSHDSSWVATRDLFISQP